MRALLLVDKIMHKISFVLCLLCALLIAVLTVIIVTDVFLRTFFSSCLVGTSTIARNMLIAIMFLGLPMITAVDGHVRSEVIINRLKPSAKLVFDMAAYFLGFLMFLLLGISLIGPTKTAILKNYFDMEATMTLRLWPIYVVTVFGSFASAYVMLSLAVRRVLKQENRRQEEYDI